MAWEDRGGRRYYYRKTRVEGKVVTEYIGQGVLGDLAAAIDARDRNRRRLDRLEQEDFYQAQRRVDRAIGTYRTQLGRLVAAVLRQAGFHQHKGQWRKARRMVDNLPASGRGPEVEEYLDLYRLAIGKPAKSDEVMLLKLYARDHPQVFDHVGFFADSAMTAVIESASTTETTRVQMAGEFGALKHRLGIAHATPLEQLLIEDIALCWLRLYMVEQLYTANMAESGMSIAKREYWEGLLSATRRRYLASIESLARVRGLLSRAGLQINIAQQQIVANR